MRLANRKIHTGRLINRHHDCTLRVQGDHGIIDVIPDPDDRTEAGRIWGGGCVAYYRRGSRWAFISAAELNELYDARDRGAKYY
jgi:hypothetical protein